MEFGDKEWFEKLEENVKFPAIIAFYLTDIDGLISHRIIESKAFNVGDIKFSKIAPCSLDGGQSMALLKVNRIHNSRDYYEIAKQLKEVWTND